MESSTAEIVSIPEGLGIISLMLLIMQSVLINSCFCLSVIVITLRNLPRGENSRDVMVLNLMRLILQTEFADERLESPLIYNNLIVPDRPIRLRAPHRPGVPVQTDAERSNVAETGTETANKTSDNEEKDGLGHVSASVEDSGENQPQTPRRRKRRKKKYDKAASQPLDSSSGDELHHLLRKQRTKRRPGQRRSRTRRTLAGRKRLHVKWPGREGTRRDAEDETLSLLKTRRMTQRPAHPGRSPSEEPVPGPSGKRLLKEKGKESQLQATAPSKESPEASCKEPPTGRRKRIRPRKGDKDPSKPPGSSTTDSEEVVQPKPLRKRKTKDKK